MDSSTCILACESGWLHSLCGQVIATLPLVFTSSLQCRRVHEKQMFRACVQPLVTLRLRSSMRMSVSRSSAHTPHVVESLVSASRVRQESMPRVAGIARPASVTVLSR